MALSVAGKTAVVTGAGSGICYSFAKLLLQQKCNVVLSDLALRPEAESLVKDFSSESTRAVFQQTDVTKWDQLDRAFEVAKREFGGFDIVCPGAGVYEPVSSPILNHHYINLVHPIYATQQAIAHFLQASKPGAVVHVSSIAAQRPIITAPLYVAAKSGISNLIRSLANLENPDRPGLPSIRVSGVAPGVIRTPLWTEHPDKLRWIDQAKDEWVEPEEVAQAMLDLIQEEDYAGGTVLEVGKDHVRRVQVLNDPGPQGPGHSVSDAGKGEKEVWDSLASRTT
ncbi:uncharacterized protein F5Z01DRAFT_720516 [Emericellopsis atlantica]|uniref:Uncharacterized protein n=1 Tax=Emericellopsis atlantica TaxID=2614577 RepID=A0A9P8CRQ7_9HYPO|nr:uncharacterized protein F5Z01DRAFT_720516 [Emericellopsis atlantica]KAG9256365.1 hypothetical protein F5Z01DRAFT_720516 [Emericellopsis atlantica]